MLRRLGGGAWGGAERSQGHTWCHHRPDGAQKLLSGRARDVWQEPPLDYGISGACLSIPKKLTEAVDQSCHILRGEDRWQGPLSSPRTSQSVRRAAEVAGQRWGTAGSGRGRGRCWARGGSRCAVSRRGVADGDAPPTR